MDLEDIVVGAVMPRFGVCMIHITTTFRTPAHGLKYVIWQIDGFDGALRTSRLFGKSWDNVHKMRLAELLGGVVLSRGLHCFFLFKHLTNIDVFFGNFVCSQNVKQKFTTHEEN